MYLSRLLIRNYRSIGSLDLSLTKGKNIIVGRNNAGKSNIVRALDIVFGERSPEYLTLTENDFFTRKEKEEIIKENSLFIFCEITRENLEEIDYEKIKKCFGYYRYSEGISSEQLKNDYEGVFNIRQDEIPSSKKAYINPKLTNQIPFKVELDTAYQFAYGFFARIEEDRSIHKEIRFFYREDNNHDWTMAFKASIRTEFLQSAIIGSFRDPQNQLRVNSFSWFGKLLQYLLSKHQGRRDLESALVEVNRIANEVFSNIKKNIQAKSLSVAFPGTEIFFQFNKDLGPEIYKNCEIYIDDGFKSELVEKGSGIQSATIIGLFNYYVREVNKKSGALLCVEEPELYLHPHARRVISDRLDEFLDGDKNQVIITTHSSEFIRTVSQGLNMILVRKEIDGTKAFPINIQSNKSLLLDNNHNEIFFADKVIVCEGFEDYILRWVAREKFPGSLDERNVSIVTAGGKDTIIKFVKLLSDLKIESYIFTDFDFFLRDDLVEADSYKKEIKNSRGVVTRIKSYRHKSLVDLDRQFFTDRLKAHKKIEEEIVDIRAQMKKDFEEEFYTAKSINQFNPKIKIKLKKLLKTLRGSGVGILDGEIESLAMDKFYLSESNKLSLDKVFDISSRLVQGEKISDIFETETIEEFLKGVL